jgi:3-oxoacyl-[acyl-carrier protein] reductase
MLMDKSLTNKIALVTGGAGGIGSAICQKLAAAGASVVATYNKDAGKANRLLETLNGADHAVFQAPNTDGEKLTSLAGFIRARYGKLDILVNNAGITTPVAHEDLDGLSDEWIDRIFQTNVRGSFATIRSCKQLLQAAARPHEPALVVNISSLAATVGIGSNVAYCASKAAVDSMTRSLGRALAPHIRVVSVSPGLVLGDYAKGFDPAFIQAHMDKTPLARLCEPEDVANAVLALATTMTFCTGNVVPVDGGRPLL